MSQVFRKLGGGQGPADPHEDVVGCTMPPAGSMPRLEPAERTTLIAWLASGAPDN